MQQQEVTIINQLGLHARAAAKLVATASRFEGAVRITKENKTVDAKSIMSVMMLAASIGTPVIVETEGQDEQQAMQAVVDLINDRFGEEQ
ncbi:MAG: phosphocarrier protein HPr [Gammaproteobacteria bacterium]|nr:MAG: phosphocarrier protein HPr [Pseudomonadota bacterium]PIE38197.1 MAG: phosphocarrier protein HPr [Gammaproteobacteria bacterium]